MAYKFISPTTYFVIAPLKGLVKGFCSKLLVNMSKSLIFVLDYILCTCSLVQGGLETGKACERCLARTGYSCLAVLGNGTVVLLL